MLATILAPTATATTTPALVLLFRTDNCVFELRVGGHKGVEVFLLVTVGALPPSAGATFVVPAEVELARYLCLIAVASGIVRVKWSSRHSKPR